MIQRTSALVMAALALLAAARAQAQDDERPVKLVSEGAAYSRLLCLRLVSMRGTLEEALASMPKDKQSLRPAFIAHFKEQMAKEQQPQVMRACSREERATLALDLGKWKQQQLLDASWRLESAAMIAWALGYVKTLPAWDEQVDAAALFKQLDTTPRLRGSVEVGKARALAELWHWRARTTQLEKEGKTGPLPAGWTLPRIIEQTAALSEKSGYFHAKGKDFPAFGKPYRDLNDTELSMAQSIAMERHRALNWLCGFAADWDRVPTDT
jgi:uncharacterized protein DUF4272